MFLRITLKEFQDKSERLGWLAMENQLCWYCNKNVAKTRDHIYPESRGGKQSDNLIPCCLDCNRRKGAGLFNVWIPKMVSRL